MGARKTIRLTVILLTLFSAINVNYSQTNYTKIDSALSSIAKNNLTGITACFIKNGKIRWQGNYGFANLEDKAPVTGNTLFMLASVSKTVTGTALMILYDKGKFKLDEDISDYLHYKVRNPKFPDVPITFRMLLNHSSSLKDNIHYIDSLYVYGDSREPGLVELSKRLFDVKGKYYSAKNFTENKPGAVFVYSNLNYVMIAGLVEIISGKDFPSFCKEFLFDPLEMKETSWFMKDLDSSHVAYNYVTDNRAASKRRRIPHYGWPGYPDGCLRTSISQYSHFAMMLLHKGTFNGRQILSPQTVSQIFSLQKVDISKAPKVNINLAGMGLTWHFFRSLLQGFYYHTGGGTGITTFVFIDPVSKSGAIAFTTGTMTRATGTALLNLLLQ